MLTNFQIINLAKKMNVPLVGVYFKSELKNMTLQDYEIMKELVIKIPKNCYHPYAIDNFTGIIEILNNMYLDIQKI